MLELDKIYNMDCLEGMKQIPENFIDLVLTDPPFGINHDNAEWDKNIDFKDLIINLDKEFIRILKDGGYYFIWIPKKELLKIGTYLNDIDYFMEIQPFSRYKRNMHWINSLTPIIVKLKNKSNHRTIGGKNYFLTNSANTGNNKNNPRKINHPASKGVDTCKYVIKHYSNENDIVLDCFIGSGSILMGCKLLNRRFIGFEISKEYCDIAQKRLDNVPERLEKWIEG